METKSLPLAALHASASVVGIVAFSLTYVTSGEVVFALGIVGVAFLAAFGLFAVWGVYESVRDKKNSVAVRTRDALILGGLGVLMFGGVSQTTRHDLHHFGELQIWGLIVIALLVLTAAQIYKGARKSRWKECPDCANKVLAKARKCEHCGYEFAPAPAASQTA